MRSKREIPALKQIDRINITLQRMREHLARGEQVLVFLNRRGYCPVLLCHQCGWQAQCQHCDARLVLHWQQQRLQCHHCSYQCAVPKTCPDCKLQTLLPVGYGTERVEQSLQALFPDHNTLRIDRDTTSKKGSFEKQLAAIEAGEAHLLLGTQLLAKGHHFKALTLVVILDADQGLMSSDYRASERLAQLLLQVAGRAGREQRPGAIVLQTHYPQHPLLRLLAKGEYAAVAAALWQERQQACLPPASHDALLCFEAKQASLAYRLAEQVVARARSMRAATVTAHGPLAAVMQRKADLFRVQVLLQAQQRGPLHTVLQSLVDWLSEPGSVKRVRWHVDVDPIDLL